MRIFAIISLFLSLATVSYNASACLDGYVKLNETDALSADGLYGSKGLMVTVDDMKKQLLSKGRAVYNMGNAGVTSHRVEYLGSIADDGGIISSSYIVLDMKTKEEKVIRVQSSYAGNGMRSKDIPPAGSPTTDEQLTKLQGFSSLYSVGCQ
jgi:hypothetical protein